MPAIFAKLFTGLGLKIMGGLAILGAVAAVLLGARQAGRNAERVDAMRRTLKSVEVRNDVERKVLRSGGDAARKQLLDGWSRD